MISPPPTGSFSRQTARPPRADAARGLLIFVLVVVTLYFGREVLVPIALALLLTFLLAAPVGWFRRLYLGRIPSVVLAVTLALSILVVIGGLIIGQLRELAADIPNYATTIERKVDTIKADTLGRISHNLHGFITSKPASSSAPSSPQTAPGAALLGSRAAAPLAIPASVLPGPWQVVEQYISPLMSPLATIFIVFVVAVFALLQREDLRDRLIRLVGPDDIHRTTLALDDAGRRLIRYFLSQLAINTVFGIVVAIGLFFLGIPKPLLWGILATILRFIPYIGSTIAAALPIVLAAAVKPGWSTAIYTLIFYILAEGVTGQLLEPMVYGQSSGLSPFSVIVSAIFWSWVWGPVGLLLSTPLTLCLAVMGRHIKGLEILDILLGDRPPLTPTESFYQRILADDADEVLDQAEALLRDITLCRYYDEVALPGMQLAARDAELGVLTTEQQESVRSTIFELVAGLAEQIAGTSESSLPARPPATILSIAGRGPLDEPAAAMLCHLVGHLGVDARLIKYRDVSRNEIERLDRSNIAMVCIAYLNITGSPAHLRYLVQRLRRNLGPSVPILVGLWSPEDATPRTEAGRAAIGADFYAGSFAQILKFVETLAVPAQDDPVKRDAPRISAATSG